MARAEHVFLTDRFIRTRPKAPAGRRVDYHDALVPGLALRVTDSGHRSFVLRARYPRDPHSSTRRALGDWVEANGGPSETAPHLTRVGRLTLEAARATARHWLEMIDRGVDPRDEADRQHAATRARLDAEQLAARRPNFETVARAYVDRAAKGADHLELERRAAALRERRPGLHWRAALRAVEADPRNAELVARARRERLAHWSEAERIIRSEFVARWGDRPADEIAPAEVAAAIRAIVDRGSSAQAHNALGHIRRLYNWALGTHQFGLDRSPVDRLRPGDLIGRRWARERVLTDDELRALWAVCDGPVAASALAAALDRRAGRDRLAPIGYPAGPMIRLLLLTGQRRGEVAGMRWREIDLDAALWTIPAERMKGGRAHAVPLAPMALDLVRSLPRFALGDAVFSTTDGASSVNGFGRTRERIDARLAERIPGVAPWVIHDIRRTVRTHFSALGGVTDTVRELVIAHAQRGIHAVYDRHAYLTERRDCLVKWERRLHGILNPAPAGAVDIGAARARRGARDRSVGG
jgi:integrase